jgi:hypothetical protein
MPNVVEPKQVVRQETEIFVQRIVSLCDLIFLFIRNDCGALTGYKTTGLGVGITASLGLYSAIRATVFHSASAGIDNNLLS